MQIFLLILSVATLLFFAIFALQLAVWHRFVRFLRDIPPATAFPLVSIIIPVRNEERNLEEALRSVLAQEYPNLEIIAVDDRSTDRTGGILAEMARQRHRLRVISVIDLPVGWLGKNHALHLGASEARGDYLLFTDADVVMAPDSLSRAMGRMLAGGLDHLAVGPQVTMQGALLNMFAGAFLIFFTLYARPWALKNPKSKSHIGIGAFNLVRAGAYRSAGGHTAIAMRPDDDMKLGKLLKMHGFSQELVSGKGMIRVEWYASLGELVRGLEKNSFAGIEYRLSALIINTLVVFAFFVWPFAALLLTSGVTQLLNAAAIAILAIIYLYSAHLYGIRARYGVGLPLATLLFIYILWRSALTILKNDGIDWRGTHYPLDKLKANRLEWR